GSPDLVLGQDRRKGIMPAVLLGPVPQRAPGNLLAGALTGRSSFLARRQKVVHRRGRGRWVRGIGGHRAYGTSMATLDDVALMASELPEATEGERHGNRTWFVGGKAFAWDRPFSKADIRRFGDQTPPDGPILAVRVEDPGEKEAVLAANPDAF